MGNIKTTSIARISHRNARHSLYHWCDEIDIKSTQGTHGEWSEFSLTVKDKNVGIHRSQSGCSKNSPIDETFNFERVYDMKVWNDEDFYNHAIWQNISDSISKRRSKSSLVHGSSTSERTCSLFGSDKSPGIIYSVLFQLLRHTSDISLSLSSIGIERDAVHDLLLDEIRKSKTFVSMRADVTTVQDVYSLLYKIEVHRGRLHDAGVKPICGSHLIVEIRIEPPRRSCSEQQIESEPIKITFVDFCGIDSLDSQVPISDDPTQASHQVQAHSSGDEAVARQTMLALEKCMQSRVSPKSSMFNSRESRLTSLLRQNLVNDDFIIISIIDPTLYKESLNTLRFSSKLACRGISKAMRVLEGDDAETRNLSRNEKNSAKVANGGIIGPNQLKPRESHDSATVRSITPSFRSGLVHLPQNLYRYSEIHSNISQDLFSREKNRAELLDQKIDERLDFVRCINEEISVVDEKSIKMKERISNLKEKRDALLNQKAYWTKEASDLQLEIKNHKSDFADLMSLYDALRRLLGKK